MITDDLESIAIKTLTNRDDRGGRGARRRLRPGPLRAQPSGGSERASTAVVKAVKKGDARPREQLQASYDRITALKDALGSTEPTLTSIGAPE